MLKEIYGHSGIVGKNILIQHLEICLSVCLFAFSEFVLFKSILTKTTFQYFVNLYNLPLNIINNHYVIQTFLQGT